MKNIGALTGLILGLASIFGSYIWEGGTFDKIFMGTGNDNSFGWNICRDHGRSSIQDLFKDFSAYEVSLFSSAKYDVLAAVEKIVNFASLARKEGILSLEREVGGIDSPFFQKFIKYAIDGTDPDTIRNIGETEISYMTDRHSMYSNLFVKMGGYSPTMGIIGTVMGLIVTLANAGSAPEELVRHIATVFIATLWGIFMANIVWLPISDKLKSIHAEEELFMDVVVEGTLCIQSGEIPTLIRAKLYTILPSKDQPIERKG